MSSESQDILGNKPPGKGISSNDKIRHAKVSNILSATEYNMTVFNQIKDDFKYMTMGQETIKIGQMCFKNNKTNNLEMKTNQMKLKFDKYF